MFQEEFKEWEKDIKEAENAHPNFFANGVFVRSLFRISQHIDAAGQQVGYLTGSVNAVRETLNKTIEELNTNIKKADESSEKLAKALNRLTFWGVIITSAGLVLSLIQFLYTSKIWPFIQ